MSGVGCMAEPRRPFRFTVIHPALAGSTSALCANLPEDSTRPGWDANLSSSAEGDDTLTLRCGKANVSTRRNRGDGERMDGSVRLREYVQNHMLGHLHGVRALRRIVLPALKRFSPGDITIRHH